MPVRGRAGRRRAPTGTGGRTARPCPPTAGAWRRPWPRGGAAPGRRPATGACGRRDGDGRWAAGCSVPLLAGRALLRSLSVEPGGHCLLAPAHAGLVVAARERLGPDPVLFVVQPDLDLLPADPGGDDFSADLAAGRLWFAAGDGWAAEFRRAFDAHPGLAVPARFVQTRLTPDAAVPR